MTNIQNFELRTLTFIDSIQPQLVKFIAEDKVVCKNCQPQDYDAVLLLEIAPAMAIHHLIDVALKNTQVRLGTMLTERRFGLLEIHHPDQGEVKEAARAILRAIGLTDNDRKKMETLTSQIIRGVEEDHAALLSKVTRVNAVDANDSLLIMEATPAAYLAIGCNEALKAAKVKLIDIVPYGATGRLILSGRESEIDSAAEAAQKILNVLNQMQTNKSGSQLD